MTSDTRPRVLLADDHQLLLEALARLLEPACEVVGRVTDGRALLEAADRLHPDVVVTDVSMPGVDGMQAARQLIAAHPEVRVVVLTMHDDPYLAAEAFALGASGFLLKNSAGAELLHAVREALQDGTYLTPLIAGGDLAALERLTDDRSPVERLSPREKEVLVALAEGLGMKQVGARLGITPRTVAFHKYRLMKTINASSNAELVQFAMRHRLLPG